MMNRIIGGAMWVVMAYFGLAVALGVFATARAETLNDPFLVVDHIEKMSLELAALVVVAALYSIWKRLAAIEAKLKDR